MSPYDDVVFLYSASDSDFELVMESRSPIFPFPSILGSLKPVDDGVCLVCGGPGIFEM